jgi:outer membrane beta-barrel protein
VLQKLGGFALAALVVSGLGGLARAQPAAPGPAKPSEAPLPSCLDQSLASELGAQLKPRGVQKRNFIKRGKVVLVAHAGQYGGDLTSSSWIAGGSLGYFFTEDFGIQAEVDMTPLTLDLDSPLNKFFGDNRFQPGMAYLALGNVVWSPIHAKMKLGGGIVHSDIMLFAGGGRLIHDAVQGISFDAGAALDLFVTSVLTIRFDARDLMAIEEIAGETRHTNNLIATVGIALWIPTGL